MDKIAEFKETIYKEAAEKKDKTLATGAAGVGLLGLSKDRILGKKTMYHGTSKVNWEKIKSEGLRASKGGTGASAAVNNADYINLSKGNVHMTRFKPFAKMYANLTDKDADNIGLKDMIKNSKNGKVIKAKMDYDKFKSMKIDPAGASDDVADQIPKFLRGYAKNLAAKGNIDVSPEEIVGSSAKNIDRIKHTFKALPGYIKNNPGRFGAGVAMAGAGGLLLGKAIKNKMEKKAALNSDVKLHPHQQRVINKPGDGVVIAHTTGSGKTVTGIARFEKLKAEGKAKKALVVVPAGLRDNFGVSGVKKFTDSKYNIIGNKGEIGKGTYNDPDPNADYNIISYEMFRSNPEHYLKVTGADTVISDEQHKIKNEGTATTDALKRTRGMYKNYIGLTGSVVSNSIADVQPLVDVASNGKHNLGKTKEEFEKSWLRRSKSDVYKGMHEKRIPVTGFNNKKKLQEELGKYVDYVDYDDVKELANMPGKNIHVTKVPITREQAKIYRGLLKENPAVRKMITTKRLETLKDDEAAKAFSTLVESRKLMNSIGSVKPGMSLSDSAKLTPKTKKLLDDLEKHLKTTNDGQALLFSHLINGGVDVMEQGLKDRKISYGKFIGKGNAGVTEEGRQKDVTDFNNRKKKVMLISSAGGEGISLNDTTWEGVLDPHYNPERMKQMEARGVRSGGLSHRKPKDRNVEINRYIATMPKTLGIFRSGYKTPDEFIYEIAQKKDKQNQLLFNLLKEQQKKQDKLNNKK